MFDDRCRCGAVTPPAGPTPPCQLQILVVKEQTFIEESDVVEVRAAQQHCPAGPCKDVCWFVELASVWLQPAPVDPVAVGCEVSPDIVDEDYRVVASLDRAPCRVDADRAVLLARGASNLY